MRKKSKPAFHLSILRHVFPTWWISVPPEFEETFIHGDDYWHAWDANRSVSLTSMLLTDDRDDDRPVMPAELLAVMTPPPGKPVAMPDGLQGWAVVIDVPPPARASRAVSGIIAVEGRVLIATVTADDIDWATTVWRSIQYGPEAAVPHRSPVARPLERVGSPAGAVH